jgi:hypothetical protein
MGPADLVGVCKELCQKIQVQGSSSLKRMHLIASSSLKEAYEVDQESGRHVTFIVSQWDFDT